MATFAPQVNNQLIKFRNEVEFDFLRASRFDAYMGDGGGNIINRFMDFAEGGKQLNVPLINQLVGPGVGAGTLIGAEESMDDYGFPIWPDYARNAVTFNKLAKDDATFNIPSTAKMAIRNWAKLTFRNDMVDCLLTIPTATIQANRGTQTGGGNRVNGIRWRDASAAQRNSFSDNNLDRILFGGSVANRVAGNAASSLANVTVGTGKLTASIVSLMRRRAMLTTAAGQAPAISPYVLEGTDEEWFVMFAGTRAFRDLKQDPVITAANRDARPREGSPEKTGGNPLFTGGMLVWDGVLIKEIPEITNQLLLAGVGGAGIDVEPVLLCGQNAFAYGVSQMPKVNPRDHTDYGFVDGIGIEASYALAKIAKAPALGPSTALKDFGVHTGFVAATPDT
jgi:Protein of unknown function (DUF4043)